MELIKNSGNNSHGFSNEYNIVNALNNKKIYELPSNLKKFILSICSDNNISHNQYTKVKSKLASKQIDITTGRKINPKVDLFISIGENVFGISTKIGSGNSVHQEKVDSFIEWAINSDNIIINDYSVLDDLKFFIWADGTLDGTAKIVKDVNGKIKGRFSTSSFKKLYPEKRDRIQEFLNLNKLEIIKRALFFGKTNTEVHYIYHGNTKHGKWLKKTDLINLNLNYPLSNSTLNVGRLSFQIYNSDLKGTKSGASKRGFIQLKYGSISKDLEMLMLLNSNNTGSFEGDIEEFNFSQMLNKNKKHKFWNILLKDLKLSENSNLYAIKVEGRKYSRIIEKKVMCKSDCYLISTPKPINRELLLKNNHQLTESDLKYIENYNIITDSGVSIKIQNSTNYTISKISISTFKNIFNSYINNIDYYIASLIFYTSKKKVNLNSSIASNLNINIKKFISFVNSTFNIQLKSLSDTETLSKLNKLIKKDLVRIINENIEIKEGIFTGKGWFESPYYINYVYSQGELTKNLFPKFIIDNGSGRSKGNYTIIIKPTSSKK